MFQEMFIGVELFVFVIQVHTIPQNIFLMQSGIFVSISRKTKNTSTENKNLSQK